MSQDPIGFAAGDSNLYRYVGNSATNFTDASGLASDPDGHHIVPQQLWDEFGFSQGAKDIFDGKVARIMPDDGSHDFSRHGPKTGYTGHVKVELNDQLEHFLERNGIKDDTLTAEQQEQFAREFVDYIKHRTKNKYILGFNKAAAEGTEAVKKWYKYVGSTLPKPVLAQKLIRIKLAKRLLRKGIAFLPGPAGFFGSVIFFPSKAEAKGFCPALKDEIVDNVPLVDMGKAVLEGATGHDFIPDKGEVGLGQWLANGIASWFTPWGVADRQLRERMRRLEQENEGPSKAGQPLLATSPSGDPHRASLLDPRLALRTGVISVSFESQNGIVDAAQAARVQDALTSLNYDLIPFGVILVTLDALTDASADIRIRVADTSACGSAAVGVLGCTKDSGEITILSGWKWYTGHEVSAVDSGEYDFQTVVTHELGHALGLGHSHDSASVMYGTLTTGAVRRNMTGHDQGVIGDRVHSANHASRVGTASDPQYNETPNGGCGCPLCSAFRNEALCIPNGPATESHRSFDGETSERTDFSVASADGQQHECRQHVRNRGYVIETVILPGRFCAFSLEDKDAGGTRPDDVLVAGDGDDLQLGEPGQDILIGGVAFASECKNSVVDRFNSGRNERDVFALDTSIQELLRQGSLSECLDID